MVDPFKFDLFFDQAPMRYLFIITKLLETHEKVNHQTMYLGICRDLTKLRKM